uniref:Uncharacterized protein n=1 Tax=Trypanosoma congolense (strain IL3000) TaxID=1068625 RepID=G0V094_TRYCI|nr:hypothetical protein, unlikely [Trypanosoma congolense IL3000]
MKTEGRGVGNETREVVQGKGCCAEKERKGCYLVIRGGGIDFFYLVWAAVCHHRVKQRSRPAFPVSMSDFVLALVFPSLPPPPVFLYVPLDTHLIFASLGGFNAVTHSACTWNGSL